MPPIAFDISASGTYIRSFVGLHAGLEGRAKGKILELTVTVPDPVSVFIESSSLYLVAFRGRGGKIVVLEGGDEDYMAYFPAKEFGKDIVDPKTSKIPARYDDGSWKIVFSKPDLAKAANLPNYYDTGNRTEVKNSIDRLAFGICEAARFIPIRCAVACELADDFEFRKVIDRLVKWSKGLIKAERTISKTTKTEDLSPADARLRRNLGEKNMKVFGISENAFQNLSGVQKWLALLSGGDLTEKDRERSSSLSRAESVSVVIRLGDFRALMTNWQKFSIVAQSDPNFSGLLSEFHHRHTAGSVPAEDSLTLAEWH